MKLSATTLQAALSWAALMGAPACEASRSHQQLHRLLDKKYAHSHHHRLFDEPPLPISPIQKRGGSCAFPTDDSDLVAVTPNEMNGGWAMSPDQSCEPDMYCPYACKPGMVMAQWDPDSTYDYPASMNGGLYCDENGKVSKPFENKPYCVEGTGTVKAVNKAGKDMSWCQTVLPGNEAMLIPTVVSSIATIAVPDTSYWCETAAHFYLNPPGTGEEGCIWGDESQPIGNWSPFVAGANTDSNGQTFVKLGWNPIYEESSLFKSTPTFGVKIECPDGGCTGLPCEIDPSSGGAVDSLLGGTGAGGSDFCVVTVSKGSEAHVVAFTPGGGSSDDSDETEEDEEDEEEEDEIEIEAEPTPVEPTTTSEAPEPTTTPEEPTTTSTTSTTSTTVEPPTTTSADSTWSPTPSPSSTKSSPSVKPGIFQEKNNGTSTSYEPSSTSDSESSTETEEDDEASTSDDSDNGAGRRQGPATAGLVVAFVAAACFF